MALLPAKWIIGSNFTASLFNVSSLSEASFVTYFILTASISSANAPMRSMRFCISSFIFFSFLV